MPDELTPPDAGAEAARAAYESVALFRRVQARLGERFYVGGGGVTFEASPSGRYSFLVGDVRYFQGEAGELVSARTVGGRVEYSLIGQDGRITALAAAPLTDPRNN